VNRGDATIVGESRSWFAQTERVVTLRQNNTHMIFGVPREIKIGETRVSMTPALCRRLTALGSKVLVERGAGVTAGFRDTDYRAAGAKIVPAAAQVWAGADLVLKVKEPLESEYEFLRPGLALFTYLHIAAAPALGHELVRRRVLAVAYETVEAPDGTLPLLKPMSQIAGRLAVQVGAYFLQSQNGGSGVLLGGVPGTAAGKVAILGAGNSGAHAARMAVGMGARVTVLDLDSRKLDQLDSEYHGRIATLFSNPGNIERAVAEADLVVGAVLIPGARAPVVVTRAMVGEMRPGSVIVDIAVDQGGCIETIRPTSHEVPTYRVRDVVHYAVPNMPAMVGRTSTIALTQATEPFVVMFAEKGVARALEENRGLGRGVNTIDGRVPHPQIARVLGTSGG
jgi:alanine dehydrogenase